MTLRINPEQENVIGEAIRAGLIESADQAVEMGVGTIRLRLRGRPQRQTEAKNLADLFAASPFAGLDLNFERDKDNGREVAL